MNVETCLTALEAAAENADATLSTTLGGQRDETSARLWRGQVLVDWEPDAHAGDCLLRPAWVRRLILLHAQTDVHDDELVVIAPGHIVAALTEHHGNLVRRLGGARRVELTARFHFADGQFRGGQETYHLVEHGRRVALFEVAAEVRVRSAREASPHSSLAAT